MQLVLQKRKQRRQHEKVDVAGKMRRADLSGDDVFAARAAGGALAQIGCLLTS
jgi:hypothetical protein